MNIKYGVHGTNFLHSDSLPETLVMPKTFLKGDGSLKLVGWASDLGTINGLQSLGVDFRTRPTPMKHSKATGEDLCRMDTLGQTSFVSLLEMGLFLTLTLAIICCLLSAAKER